MNGAHQQVNDLDFVLQAIQPGRAPFIAVMRKIEARDPQGALELVKTYDRETLEMIAVVGAVSFYGQVLDKVHQPRAEERLVQQSVD